VLSPSTEVGGGWIYPILKYPTPFLHLVWLKASSVINKLSLSFLSLFLSKHVLFGRPLFLFPRTSKSNATFSTLFSPALRTCPNHRNAFYLPITIIGIPSISKMFYSFINLCNIFGNLPHSPAHPRLRSTKRLKTFPCSTLIVMLIAKAKLLFTLILLLSYCNCK